VGRGVCARRRDRVELATLFVVAMLALLSRRFWRVALLPPPSLVLRATDAAGSGGISDRMFCRFATSLAGGFARVRGRADTLPAMGERTPTWLGLREGEEGGGEVEKTWRGPKARAFERRETLRGSGSRRRLLRGIVC
jgi:hypothetical protein